jgi:hypothetical protein
LEHKVSNINDSFYNNPQKNKRVHEETKRVHDPPVGGHVRLLADNTNPPVGRHVKKTKAVTLLLFSNYPIKQFINPHTTGVTINTSLRIRVNLSARWRIVDPFFLWKRVRPLAYLC